jgi:hypothetical protein
MAETIFPVNLKIAVPEGLPQALTALAARQHTKRSDFIRRVLLREVEAAGVQLVEPERAS